MLFLLTLRSHPQCAGCMKPKKTNSTALIWFRKIMDNQEIRATLNYRKATVVLDLKKAHEIYHDDVIVEFPQSGERI